MISRCLILGSPEAFLLYSVGFVVGVCTGCQVFDQDFGCKDVR